MEDPIVGCPTELELARLLAGAVAEGDPLREHVAGCTTCSSWCDDAREAEGLLPEVRRACSSSAASPAAEPPGLGVSWSGTEPALGRYRVLRRAGAGGMGVVFEAEQMRPRRRVALKVLRPGAATPRSLRRLEHEAEVLARLDHPAIARIIEAGSYDSGAGEQPFFAMEWVEGRPLLEHVRAKGLDTRERLELFLAICDAVEHAHRHAVIHRDLKPANVLVRADGRPVVLDFGVARLAEAERRETLETLPGQLVGTLAYMSPEQIGGPPTDLDTRSDVYALGALLFELLAGRPPHDLAGRSVPEAARIVQELHPPRLGSLCRASRDVETIVAKALEKDRARRYGSVAELAADVGRVLRSEPIAARPPSALYRMGRFARRNRVLEAASAAVLLAILAGLVAARREARIARAAEGDARRETRQARATSDVLRDILAAADPLIGARGADFTVREALEEASRRIESLAGEPEVEIAVRRTLGDSFSGLGLFEEAERHLSAALALARARFDGTHAEVTGCFSSLAVLHERAGRPDKAEPFAREALAGSARASGEDAAETALARMNLGSILLARGRLEESAEMLERAAQDLCAPGVERPREGATALAQLARLRKEQGRADEAEVLWRRSLELCREHLGADHPFTVLTMGNLGVALVGRGNEREAEPLLEQAVEASRRVLGENSRTTATTFLNLAFARHEAGRLEEAEELARAGVEIRRSRCAGHPDLAQAFARLAGILEAQGNREEAASCWRDAAETLEPFPDQARERAHALAALARLALAQRDAAAAEQHFREALELLDASGSSAVPRAVVLNELGVLLLNRGDPAGAEASFREAVELFAETPEVVASARARGNLATAVTRQGRHEEAEQLYRELLARASEPGSPTASSRPTLLNNLARTLRSRGSLAESETLQREAVSAWREAHGDEHASTVIGRRNLAELLLDLGRIDEARSELDAILPAADKLFPAGHPRLAELRELHERVK